MSDHWVSDCGAVRLYLGDCRDVLGGLEGIDGAACVCDPPYGIDYSHRKVTTGKWVTKHHGQRINGDDKPFDPSHLLAFKELVLWGGIYFPERLPRGGWLIWDKRRGVEDVSFSMSDGEVAWTNATKSVRIFRHLWFGLARDSEIGEHHHPTQKPVALMDWCLGFVKSDLIVDPYMGSGPVGLAAIRQGRRYVGIECDPAHFETAKRRIIAELNRTPLFEQPSVLRQTELC